MSVITALQEAVTLVGQRLFPFRLERWFALGFVAFLDSCGRGGGGGAQFPGGGGGGGPSGSSGSGEGGGPDLSAARDWIGEHLAIILAVSVFVLLFVVTLMAIVLWINSRGVFMYLDDVATGRADIVRPWREHGERAWSYFGWSFGGTIVTFLGFLLLLAPIGYSIYLLVTGGASCGPIAGLVAAVVLLIGFLIFMSLFQLLLRNFAAPLQLALDVPCGRALGVAWGLVKTNPLSFLGYLGLKILFGIVAAIVAIVVGCFTCCIGFLPVISHTLLQPLLYFERAWSLLMLRQAGYDLFPAAPPPATPPTEPPTAAG